MQYLEDYDLTGKSQKLAKLISDNFGSISKAARALGFSRPTIYNWIQNGEVSHEARDRLRGAGYDPDTLQKTK